MRTFSWRIGVVAVLLAAGARPAAPAAPAAAPPTYYPGPHDAWERRAPESVGLDAARLQEAVAFAVASETRAPRDLALEHSLSYG